MDAYEFVAHQPDEAARGEGPHVWVQWKGTILCADVHCSCGESSHIDADFCYAVQCPHCGKVWALSMNVAMYDVDPAQWDGCEPQVATP